MIYVRCNKAIYNAINTSLLACEKLAKLLKEWVMIINLHDPCIWNMDVNSAKMTLILHVDDLIMSHKHSCLVAEYIKKLCKENSSQD